MLYHDHTPLQIAGQLLIAFLFLGTGVRNAATQFRQHLDRMVALGVPQARLALIGGFAMQLVGGTLIALDYERAVGAWILITFTVFATAIFHRFWNVADPLLRHLHISFVFSNCGVVGALLLLT